MIEKKITCIIEARMSSSRLPGKVLMECLGKPMIKHQIDRIKKSKAIHDIIVATTVNKSDDILVDFCVSNNINYFRGSELNVLSRVLQCAENSFTDIIVEIPGDCPLVDYTIVDRALDIYINNNFDYVCNNMKPTFPGSFDVQVFSTNVLKRVSLLTQDPIDQEHVSLFIYRNQNIFKCKNFEALDHQYAPNLGFQLDTYEDYLAICKIFCNLKNESMYFSCKDVIDLIRKKPEIRNINKNVKRKKV